MILKKISIFFALLSISLLIVFATPKIAKAAILTADPPSAPAGSDITILGTTYCIHNAGIAVTLKWDGSTIGTATSPVFFFSYHIPAGTSAGAHTIYGEAFCPGLPPGIPPYPDVAIFGFNVTSSGSGSTATPTTSGTKAKTSSSISPNASTSISPSGSVSISPSSSNQTSSNNNQGKPWYKNWKYLAFLIASFLILAAAIVWVIIYEKHKHQKKELEQVMPRIKRRGK